VMLLTILIEMEVVMKEKSIVGNIRSALLTIFIASLATLITLSLVNAQELKTIKLPAVNKNRAGSLMDALSKKASAQTLSEKDLSQQDLSDLLWAAAGINRTDTKKRTFSSAMNTQDVDVYVFMKDGVYIYDYENQALNPILSGDHRADIAGSMTMGAGGPSGGASGAAPAGTGQPGGAPAGAPAGAGQSGGAPGGAQAGAPGGSAGGPPSGGARPKMTFAIDLLLVSDPAKYRAGNDDLKKEWGAYSAGMISQNIMLFCAANNMGTRPRASFDKAKLRILLKLKDTQNPVIELPVGYLQ
jgi:nitroreductase